jgi:DNA-binding winged helix-turn-helix (wHTH) protein
MGDLPLVRVDVPGHRAWLGDQKLDVSGLDLQLLLVLTGNADRAMSYADIIANVWGVTWRGAVQTVQTHIGTLRGLLGDTGKAQRYIATVYGAGYRFEADMLDPASVLHARPVVAAEDAQALTVRMGLLEERLFKMAGEVAELRRNARPVRGGVHA